MKYQPKIIVILSLLALITITEGGSLQNNNFGEEDEFARLSGIEHLPTTAAPAEPVPEDFEAGAVWDERRWSGGGWNPPSMAVSQEELLQRASRPTPSRYASSGTHASEQHMPPIAADVWGDTADESDLREIEAREQELHERKVKRLLKTSHALQMSEMALEQRQQVQQHAKAVAQASAQRGVLLAKSAADAEQDLERRLQAANEARALATAAQHKAQLLSQDAEEQARKEQQHKAEEDAKRVVTSHLSPAQEQEQTQAKPVPGVPLSDEKIADVQREISGMGVERQQQVIDSLMKLAEEQARYKERAVMLNKTLAERDQDLQHSKQEAVAEQTSIDALQAKLGTSQQHRRGDSSQVGALDAARKKREDTKIALAVAQKEEEDTLKRVEHAHEKHAQLKAMLAAAKEAAARTANATAEHDASECEKVNDKAQAALQASDDKLRKATQENEKLADRLETVTHKNAEKRGMLKAAKAEVQQEAQQHQQRRAALKIQLARAKEALREVNEALGAAKQAEADGSELPPLLPFPVVSEPSLAPIVPLPYDSGAVDPFEDEYNEHRIAPQTAPAPAPSPPAPTEAPAPTLQASNTTAPPANATLPEPIPTPAPPPPSPAPTLAPVENVELDAAHKEASSEISVKQKEAAEQAQEKKAKLAAETPEQKQEKAKQLAAEVQLQLTAEQQNKKEAYDEMMVKNSKARQARVKYMAKYLHETPAEKHDEEQENAQEQAKHDSSERAEKKSASSEKEAKAQSTAKAEASGSGLQQQQEQSVLLHVQEESTSLLQVEATFDMELQINGGHSQVVQAAASTDASAGKGIADEADKGIADEAGAEVKSETDLEKVEESKPGMRTGAQADSAIVEAAKAAHEAKQAQQQATASGDADAVAEANEEAKAAQEKEAQAAAIAEKAQHKAAEGTGPPAPDDTTATGLSPPAPPEASTKPALAPAAADSRTAAADARLSNTQLRELIRTYMHKVQVAYSSLVSIYSRMLQARAEHQADVQRAKAAKAQHSLAAAKEEASGMLSEQHDKMKAEAEQKITSLKTFADRKMAVIKQQSEAQLVAAKKDEADEVEMLKQHAMKMMQEVEETAVKNANKQLKSMKKAAAQQVQAARQEAKKQMDEAATTKKQAGDASAQAKQQVQAAKAGLLEAIDAEKEAREQVKQQKQTATIAEKTAADVMANEKAELHEKQEQFKKEAADSTKNAASAIENRSRQQTEEAADLAGKVAEVAKQIKEKAKVDVQNANTNADQQVKKVKAQTDATLAEMQAKMNKAVDREEADQSSKVQSELQKAKNQTLSARVDENNAIAGWAKDRITWRKKLKTEKQANEAKLKALKESAVASAQAEAQREHADNVNADAQTAIIRSKLKEIAAVFKAHEDNLSTKVQETSAEASRRAERAARRASRAAEAAQKVFDMAQGAQQQGKQNQWMMQKARVAASQLKRIIQRAQDAMKSANNAMEQAKTDEAAADDAKAGVEGPSPAPAPNYEQVVDHVLDDDTGAGNYTGSRNGSAPLDSGVHELEWLYDKLERKESQVDRAKQEKLATQWDNSAKNVTQKIKEAESDVDQVEQSAIDTANQTLSNITQITGKGPAANTSSLVPTVVEISSPRQELLLQASPVVQRRVHEQAPKEVEEIDDEDEALQASIDAFNEEADAVLAEGALSVDVTLRGAQSAESHREEPDIDFDSLRRR